MRPRRNVEQAASETARPRRRPVLRFRPKRRRAKSKHVVSNPAISVPSASEPASKAAAQFLQTPPVEQRTEERKQLIATSAGQFLLWLPIDVRSDAGKQPHQVHIIETQLEQMTGETEPVIAALVSAEQLELSWRLKATTDAGEQSLQAPSVEQRTEERKQLIATSAGQFLLWLPIDVRADAGEQPHQVHIIETQLEQMTAETEPVIAASASAEQLELSWPSKATTDAGEQLSETKIFESPLEQSRQQSEQVIATPPEDIKPNAPSEITSDAPKESSQSQTAEPELDERAKESGIDTTLFQTEELVFVPWRTDEALETILPSAETVIPIEPPSPGMEVCNRPQEPQTEPSSPAPGSAVNRRPSKRPRRKRRPKRTLKMAPVRAIPDDRQRESGDGPATLKLEEQAQELPASAVKVCDKPEEPHNEPSTSVVACFVENRAENQAGPATPVEKVAREADAKIPPAPEPPAESLDVAAPAPATPCPEEQAKTPPPFVAEVCKREEPHAQESIAAGAQCNQEFPVNKLAEQPAFEGYAMIPPAPSAPVPGRTEFAARQQAPANSLLLDEGFLALTIERVSGLGAVSGAPSQPSTEKPAEPDPVTAKTEEAVEEAKPASLSPPTVKETSDPDVTKPIEGEKPAEIGAQTENSSQQTAALEPESDMLSTEAAQDEEANKKIEQPPKKKVLVVDDDPTLRMLLKMGLEPHGYECLLAENGKAAQAVIQAHHPALILVDLLMPIMDGLTFVQWLRGTAKDSTPVLVFTNLDDAKITQQALDGGANAFACKPLRLKELLQTMKELVPT